MIVTNVGSMNTKSKSNPFLTGNYYENVHTVSLFVFKWCMISRESLWSYVHYVEF